VTTECTQRSFVFHRVGGREVVARFDGGPISSDGGLLLLRQVEERTGIIAQLAACFADHRDPQRIEHPLGRLIAQRIYALALGNEDLNDHDLLRQDPLLAAVVGCRDPLGQDRRREQDRGKALAGKSTLNRLELTPVGADEESRYKKVVACCRAIDRLLVDLFLQAHAGAPPASIVLDLDSTDDPVHGEQLGRFFHGYYDEYCYLPLYVMCGPFVLAAKLRPSNIDGAAGALKVIQRIVEQVRAAWPHVRITLRADSGFCRDPIMTWCEQNRVDYLLGLARNQRLLRAIGQQMHEAEQASRASGQAARVFADLEYRTHKTWGRSRRVVAKAEHLGDKANPRFVVTSIPAAEAPAQRLYEQDYCARGDMENRIKEQQLCLFADRTSAATMRANQVRLYFSTIAYTLMLMLRRLGLQGTALEPALASTVRVRLLKIGARVRVTARKVWVSLSSAFPLREVFALAHQRLLKLPLWPAPAARPSG
jgi:hypothetical protein